MRRSQKTGYLSLGAIVIGIVVILLVYIAMVALGMIKVSSYHLVITTASADKLYDGEALTSDEWELIDGELASGHTISATVTGSQTGVGVSDNTINVTISDSKGKDVTEKYEIEYQLGELSVNGQFLEFSSASADKYYDGSPLTADECTLLSGELAAGHEYTARVTGSVTEIGEAENTLEISVVDTETGEDVTDRYYLIIHTGTLRVKPIRLVISGNLSGAVDGGDGESSPTGDLSFKDCVVAGRLLDGHTLNCRPLAGELEGISYDAMSVYVTDEDGKDVTEFYDIHLPFLDDLTEQKETESENREQQAEAAE